MKNLIQRSILIIVSLVALNAHGMVCTDLFAQAKPSPAFADAINTFRISESAKAKIESYARSLGYENMRSLTELIEQMSLDVNLRFNRESATERSSRFAEMAKPIITIFENPLNEFWKRFNIKNQNRNIRLEEIGKQIEKTYQHLSPVERKMILRRTLVELENFEQNVMRVKYLVANVIAKIEEFPVSYYVRISDQSHPLINRNYVAISLKEFPDFATALAENKSPPKPYGTGGVVSFTAYRDFVSTNLWLFTLAGHDLKHIHFAQAYPMAFASLLRLTRSQNHLRYGLAAGMFEGVDTVQYGFESAIARKFNGYGYSLEHAMIHIASAPQSDLIAIGESVGVARKATNPQGFELTGYLNSLVGWQPKIVPHEFRRENMPSNYELDIKTFVASALSRLGDPVQMQILRPTDAAKYYDESIVKPEGFRSIPGENIHHY